MEKEQQSERGMRCEAIHLRGVEDMSTKDVFDYFSQYAPGSVEWIDDASCKCSLLGVSDFQIYVCDI